MTIDIIKYIPETLQKPVLVLKSKTNPEQSVVIITNIQTEKGNVIIPVWIIQDGSYLNVEISSVVSEKTNFVASAYGRKKSISSSGEKQIHSRSYCRIYK